MLNNLASHKISGNLQGETIQMGLDASGAAHIMRLLSNIYSDPEAAVLREYATNARDAQVRAGVNAPVRIVLPTPLRRTLHIKDAGTGMSLEEIKETYSRYGASTARESNDLVGSMGIGSKSGFAYSSQFTVLSVQNGVKLTVSVQRNEDDSASMTVVDTKTTSEPDGVEIIIPAKDGNKFHEKAQSIFRFWPAGSVLIDGKAPERVKTILKVSDTIGLIEGRYTACMIVMGGVPYTVPESHLGLNLPVDKAIVAYVPMGSVNFTPSRETLEMTDLTKATLKAVGEEYKASLPTAIDRELQKLPTRYEALCWLQERRDFVRTWSGLTYKGSPVLENLEGPTGETFTVVDTQGKLSAKSINRSIVGSYIPGALFVKGFRQAFTGNVKKKLLQYASEQGLTVSRFILHDGPVDTLWLDRSRIVDFKVIKAIKLPSASKSTSPRSGTGLGGDYHCWVGGEHTVLSADDIEDLGLPTFYYVMEGADDLPGRNYYSVLGAEYGEDYIVVGFTSNRQGKFDRLFPEATAVYEESLRIRTTWAQSIPLEVKRAYQAQQINNDLFLLLSARDIKDPAFAAFSALRSMDIKSYTRDPRWEHSLASEVTVESPLSAYPITEFVWFNNRHYFADSAEWRAHEARRNVAVDFLAEAINNAYEARQGA